MAIYHDTGVFCLSITRTENFQYRPLLARIAKLCQFKARKVKKLQEEDCLAIFKPDLRRMGFSDVAKNGTIFSRN